MMCSSPYINIPKGRVFRDAEHTMDKDFMTYCGVDINKMCKIAPSSAEEALEAMRTSMRYKDADGNPLLSLVVLDSVA